MRVAKILAVVALAVLVNITPGESGSLPLPGPAVRPCLPEPAISLLSSSGSIALIPSRWCSR
jgi:hypothetical protein